MARKPMITRTITTTKADVLCLNIKTGEAFNKEVVLPRTYSDTKKLMKVISEQIDNDDQKAVHVVAKTEIETLYGMTEQKFIDGAEVIPAKEVK